MMTEESAKSLIEWEPVSRRIITARFNSKGRKVTIIQCYAPTNTAEEEMKEEFYTMLQGIYDKVPARDMKIVMGDLNAKIGSDNKGKEITMGKEALGIMNENGELFSDFCAFNDLVIGGSIFPHKNIHKETWISPDGNTKNQIDHITIERKWRRSLQDVRNLRGADAASDHHLVLGIFKVKLRAFKDTCDRPHVKFNTQRLKDKEIKEQFGITLWNKFEALTEITEETNIDDHWEKLKETWTETCEETLGKKKYKMKEWISVDTEKLIEGRRTLKQKINSCNDTEEKRQLQTEYRDADKEVKKSTKKDKRDY